MEAGQLRLCLRANDSTKKAALCTNGWFSEAALYQMPSRGITHEQKIQPVANGPKPIFKRTIIAALQLSLNGLSCKLQHFYRLPQLLACCSQLSLVGFVVLNEITLLFICSILHSKAVF